jgi:hypothetical protein
LVQVVAAMSGGDRLTHRVIGLIADRIRVVNQRFRRLAARLAAGTYRPRRFARRRKPIDPKPRQKSPLPEQFGWLLQLVPQAIGASAQLEHLLRDPEMAALMAAAPASMARALRPLCWMLRVTPPPILARPKPKAAPPEAGPPETGAPPEARPPPEAGPPPPPSQTRPPRSLRPALPARPVPRACGPPRPA